MTEEEETDALHAAILKQTEDLDEHSRAISRNSNQEQKTSMKTNTNTNSNTSPSKPHVADTADTAGATDVDTIPTITISHRPPQSHSSNQSIDIRGSSVGQHPDKGGGHRTNSSLPTSTSTNAIPPLRSSSAGTFTATGTGTDTLIIPAKSNSTAKHFGTFDNSKFRAVNANSTLPSQPVASSLFLSTSTTVSRVPSLSHSTSPHTSETYGRQSSIGPLGFDSRAPPTADYLAPEEEALLNELLKDEFGIG